MNQTTAVSDRSYDRFTLWGGAQANLALFLFALLLFITACSSNRSNSDRTVTYLDLAVDTTLTIGNRADGPPEYLFERPQTLTVDSAGNIYVAAYREGAVRKYDPNGKHLVTFGGRGEGPGEFRRVHDLLMTRKGELMVVGTHSISWFTPEGEHIRTRSIEDLHRKVLEMPRGRYLMIDHDTRQRDSLFHIRSSELQPVESFGSSTDFFDVEGSFEDVWLNRFPGSTLWLDSGKLLYVPYLYEGQLHLYEESADGWKRADTWRGRVIREQPYEQVPDGQDADVTSRSWEYGYNYNNQSLGLHQTEEGLIYHFTSVDSASVRTFGVEVYDREGKLLGYGPIVRSAFEDQSGAARFPLVSAYGGEGEFYFVMWGWGDVIPHVGRISIVLGLSDEFDAESDNTSAE